MPPESVTIPLLIPIKLLTVSATYIPALIEGVNGVLEPDHEVVPVPLKTIGDDPKYLYGD